MVRLCFGAARCYCVCSAKIWLELLSIRPANLSQTNRRQNAPSDAPAWRAEALQQRAQRLSSLRRWDHHIEQNRETSDGNSTRNIALGNAITFDVDQLRNSSVLTLKWKKKLTNHSEYSRLFMSQSEFIKIPFRLDYFDGRLLMSAVATQIPQRW